MAVEKITSAENVDVGMLKETTCGVLIQAAYDLIQSSGPEFEFPSDEAVDGTTGDRGGPISKRTTSRGGNASLPAHLRFGGLTLQIEAALREDMPAAVTIVGTSDIDYLTAGTHNDGSTGLQIRAPTGDFAALLTYGAGAEVSGGASGMIVLVSGFAVADNNQPVMIKDVWDDASFAYIDIDAGYGGGAVADVFGAPKTGETLQSATLRVGTGIRNRQSGSGAVRTYSLLADYFEQTKARFQALRGWMGNDLSVAINGKGEVMVTVNGIGRGWSPLSPTAQNGQSPPAHFTSAAAITDLMYIGGKDLQYVVIVPFANAVTSTTKPILLADTQISQLSLECAGGVQAVDDVLGTDEVIPRSGQHNPSGSLGWYQADSDQSEELTEIGSTDLEQNGAVHVMWKQNDNKWIAITQPKNNFRATGSSPGAVGNAASGTLEWGSMAMNPIGRAFHWQEIDAS